MKHERPVGPTSELYRPAHRIVRYIEIAHRILLAAYALELPHPNRESVRRPPSRTRCTTFLGSHGQPALFMCSTMNDTIGLCFKANSLNRLQAVMSFGSVNIKQMDYLCTLEHLGVIQKLLSGLIASRCAHLFGSALGRH